MNAIFSSFALGCVLTLLSTSTSMAAEPNASLDTPSFSEDASPSDVFIWRLLVGPQWLGPVEENGFDSFLPGIKIGGELKFSQRAWVFAEASLNADLSTLTPQGWGKTQGLLGARFILNPGALIEISPQVKVGATIGTGVALGVEMAFFATPTLLASAGMVADFAVADSFGLRASFTALRGEVGQTLTATTQELAPFFRGAASVEPTIMAWWLF